MECEWSEKLDFFKEQDIFKFDFEFKILYEPNFADLLFEGSIILLFEEKNIVSEIEKQWKDEEKLQQALNDPDIKIYIGKNKKSIFNYSFTDKLHSTVKNVTLPVICTLAPHNLLKRHIGGAISNVNNIKLYSYKSVNNKGCLYDLTKLSIASCGDFPFIYFLLIFYLKLYCTSTTTISSC